MTIRYEDAGVNPALADTFVETISQLTKSTLTKNVKSGVGGYAALYEVTKNLWLAASTDGVGTKLKLAFQSGRHDTIGVDLVAMSVNDLLCVGALPLFFLDYFATGRLEPQIGAQVLKGIVSGCKQSGCALVGGETAEMPEFYSSGEYDLAGFAVGVVAPKQVLPRVKSKGPRHGDVLIGIASSGFHSNGYSLLRRLLGSKEREDELLTPTRIYVKALKPLLQAGLLKGLAHITGSGFLNVPRISDRVSYEIHLPFEEYEPRIRDLMMWAKDASGLGLSDLAQTFNLGLGMIAVVDPKKADLVLKKLKQSGERAWRVGSVQARLKSKKSQVVVHGSRLGTQAILEY